MHTAVLFLLGFAASALAVTTPLVKDNEVVEFDFLENLRSQLLALQKAIGADQTSAFPFPNLGFFQQSASTGNAPTPYAASTLPMYPGFAVQFTESLTNLINEVIKRQQEILQMIVGCNCGVPVEEVTTAAPAAVP